VGVRATNPLGVGTLGGGGKIGEAKNGFGQSGRAKHCNEKVARKRNMNSLEEQKAARQAKD